MKNFSKIFVLALALAAAVSSCRWPIDPTDPRGGGKGGGGNGGGRDTGFVIVNQYIDFGVMMIGEERAQAVELKSLSNDPAINITSIELQMGTPGFYTQHDELPFSYNPMLMRPMPQILVGFRATEPGEFSDVLVINGTHRVKVHATVVGKPDEGKILVETTDIMFERVKLGQTATALGYIINNSSEPVVVMSATMGGADANNFALELASNAGTGGQLPLRVAPGQKFPFAVTFTPGETNRKYWTEIKFDIQSQLNPAQIDNISNVTGACY